MNEKHIIFETRWACWEELIRHADEPSVVEAIREIAGRDDVFGDLALFALYRIGRDRHKWLATLVARAIADDRKHGWTVLELLVQEFRPPDDTEFVVELFPLLRSKNRYILSQFDEILSRFPLLSEDPQVVLEAAEHEHWKIRAKAAQSLGRFADTQPELLQDRRILSMLCQLLRDDNIHVRVAAIEAIRKHGTNPESIHALVHVFETDTYETTAAAIVALAAIGPVELVAPLVDEAYECPDPRLRVGAEAARKLLRQRTRPRYLPLELAVAVLVAAVFVGWFLARTKLPSRKESHGGDALS